MHRQPIYGLDFVRFFAAVAVLIEHFDYMAYSMPAEIPHSSTGWGWWGWIGVQIFFVISGFVIAYSAEGATWQSFIVGRVSRLLPAMVISATTIAVLLLVWEQLSGRSVVLATVQGTSPVKVALLWLKSVVFFPIGPWISGQIWTLPIEIAFYGLVWLFIALRCVHRIETLAWWLGLASATYWLAINYAGLSDHFTRITQLIPFQHGCYFALGILLSVADRHRMSWSRYTLGMICIITAWFQIEAVNRSDATGYLPFAPLLPFIIWLVVCGIISASIYWKRRIATAVGTRGKEIRFIGLVTYPLYLVHLQVGGFSMTQAIVAGVPFWSALLAGAAASLVAAWIITAYAEPTLRRIVMRMLALVFLGGRQSPLNKDERQTKVS